MSVVPTKEYPTAIKYVVLILFIKHDRLKWLFLGDDRLVNYCAGGSSIHVSISPRTSRGRWYRASPIVAYQYSCGQPAMSRYTTNHVLTGNATIEMTMFIALLVCAASSLTLTPRAAYQNVCLTLLRRDNHGMGSGVWV